MPSDRRLPKAEATGDCGDTTFALMMATGGRSLILCHGWPLGTGGNAYGMRYWHAWLEDVSGLIVYEVSNGHRLACVGKDYYAAGSIDPNRVQKYTWDEAEELFMDHGHTGPWIDNPYQGIELTEEDVYGE